MRHPSHHATTCYNPRSPACGRAVIKSNACRSLPPSTTRDDRTKTDRGGDRPIDDPEYGAGCQCAVESQPVGRWQPATQRLPCLADGFWNRHVPCVELRYRNRDGGALRSLSAAACPGLLLPSSALCARWWTSCFLRCLFSSHARLPQLGDGAGGSMSPISYCSPTSAKSGSTLERREG
jgi:hypothetical protein